MRVAYSSATVLPPLPSTVALSVLALAAGSAPAQSPSWSGRVGVATDWLVRGVAYSDGEAAVRSAGIDAYAAGWSLGLGALWLRDYLGERTSGWSLHLGYELPLGEQWQLLVDLQRSRYEGGFVLEGYGGRQFGLGLAYGDRWSLSWNVDRTIEPTLAVRSLDFNLRWPLARHVALDLGVGRVLRIEGERYGYGQAGLELHAAGARLRLDRHWVRPAAQNTYGDLARPRWVGSAQWSF